MNVRDVSDLNPIERDITEDPDLINQDKDSLKRILERARTKIFDIWEQSLDQI